MKLVYTLTLLLIVGFGTELLAQTSGGPDDYGYTWRDSNDPDGPTFNWIDITTTGTEVMGFADDNSVDFIDMGMDFHFYWLDYDRVKLGSNGWISFDNVSNLAVCFASIPTPGSGNNLICPLLADLNFDENGNPGKVYYLNDGNGKFIISYHNVPFWINAVPAYTGDNTFQVILDQADSSIVLQYLEMDDVLANPGTCPAGQVRSSVGIENISGTIGLEIIPDQVMPPDNYAVKISYPVTPLIDVPDVAPEWNVNDANGGVFVLPNEDISIVASVRNNGNTEVTSDFQITAGIRKLPIPADLWTSSATVNGLALGTNQEVIFDDPFNSDIAFGGPGNYTLTTLTTLAGDLVAGNDENVSEVVVIDNDVANPDIILSYTGDASDGTISWAGGGGDSGIGVYFEPPSYPLTIKALEAFVFNDPNGTGDDAYTIEIRDDDGPGGGPGTLIALEAIDAGSYDNGAWNRTELSFPVTINSGGFYAAWIMQGNTLALGTASAPPISRRTFEILGGSWSSFRDNEVAEGMIRICAENDQFVDVDEVELENQIRVFPNPTSDVLTIQSSLDEPVTKVEVFNTLGELMLQEKVSIYNGEQHRLDLNNLSTGIYYINIYVDEQATVRKVSVIK
ncbi:MAG: T9SS type A sorting domain-containing protein [Bacteroidota bacterium]